MKTKKRIKCLSAIVLFVAVAITALNLPAYAVSMPAISIVSVPLLAFPKAPSGLTATAGINLALNWQVKLDWKDNSSNESSFKIYRMTSGITPKVYTAIGTVSANTTTYTDLNVDLGKTYFYYVASANAAGESKSETISAAVTDSAPKVPTDLKAAKDSETAPTKVTLTWKDQSDNESGFKIYRRDSSGSTSYKLIKTLTADVETYVDSDIAANLEGMYYIYRVSAFNSVDETTSVANECSVPFCLKVPTGLSAAVTSATVDLTWTDNSAKESYYVVYRCTDGVNYQLIAGVGHEVSYHDTNLTPNTLYYYGVCAVYEADSQLGSPKALTTAKTALASGSVASSGSTGSNTSLPVSSGTASSKAPSSSVTASTSSVTSASSAAKSAASSKAKSSVQTVSAVSETGSETIDTTTSVSVTSGVESQAGQSATATFLETVQQNSLIIIGAVVILLLLVVIILLSRKRKQK